jgi:hypothetical protein
LKSNLEEVRAEQRRTTKSGTGGISAANELKSWLEALDPATEGAALVTTWKLVEEALNTSTWQASKSTLEVKEAN